MAEFKEKNNWNGLFINYNMGTNRLRRCKYRIEIKQCADENMQSNSERKVPLLQVAGRNECTYRLGSNRIIIHLSFGVYISMNHLEYIIL